MSAMSSGPDQAYRERLLAGSFAIQACARCARCCFPPRLFCPHCGARELAWRPAEGVGTVYATTVVRQRPEQGGAYNVALVELAEGPRLMSRVETMAPEAVRIGMRVRARIDTSGSEPLVVFVPA